MNEINEPTGDERDAEPIGYAQSCTAMGSGDGWWEEETDPSPDNPRAIRCYEKAGFVQQDVIATPDGPAVYMVQTREAYELARHAACRASLDSRSPLSRMGLTQT